MPSSSKKRWCLFTSVDLRGPLPIELRDEATAPGHGIVAEPVPHCIHRLVDLATEWAGTAEQVALENLAGLDEIMAPMPISRKARPSASRVRRSSAVRNISSADCVAFFRWRTRVMVRKSEVLSLSVTPSPAMPAVLMRRATISVSCHRIWRSFSRSDMSSSRVVSEDMLLVSRSGLTGRSSSPRAHSDSLFANLTVTGDKLCLLDRGPVRRSA